MTIKNCYILDNSRRFVFYGPLDEALVGTAGYNFYEVSEANKDRPLKLVNGKVIVDFQKEYDDKITYQKLAFKEYREDILKKIYYANLIGATTTVTTLTESLLAEKLAYETRVNAITLRTE